MIYRACGMNSHFFFSLILNLKLFWCYLACDLYINRCIGLHGGCYPLKHEELSGKVAKFDTSQLDARGEVERSPVVG